MYLKGQKLEVALHSIHREYKNVQKSVLTNVKIQRTGKTTLQMFVYFIFDGSFICRFLYIFRPSSVPRHSICPLQLEAYTLIINDLYLQILHSASESRFCVGKWRLTPPWYRQATKTSVVREWCHPNPAWWTYLLLSSWWSWWCHCRCDRHSCP